MMVMVGSSVEAQASSQNFGNENVFLDSFYDPAYDPIGIKFGGFLINPSVTGGLKFTDNVYATDNNPTSDIISILRPEIDLRSDFVRHKINLKGFAEFGDYRDSSSENYDDYGGKIDARIDVTRSKSVPITLGYSRLHEERGNPENRNNLNPLVYHLSEATTGLIHTGQRISYKILTNFKRLAYENALGQSGTIDESNKNRDVYGIYSSIGIVPEAILAPYLYANFLKLKYENEIAGITQDSKEYEAGIGTILNISDMIRASFHIGQKHLDFEYKSFNDINTLTYGSNLTWTPVEYISFLAEADRSIQESTFSGASPSINTSYRLSANYQLQENLFLQPSLSLLDRDYQGANTGRLETIGVGMNVLYKMNPNLWLNASYQHTTQNKKEDSPQLESFQRNVYGVSLKLQF